MKNILLILIIFIFFNCSLFIPKKIKEYKNPYLLLEEYKKIMQYSINVDNIISTFYNDTYYKGKILSEISPKINKTILTASFGIKILEFQADSSSIKLTTNMPSRQTKKYNFKNNIYGIKLNKNIIDCILLNIPLILENDILKQAKIKNNTLNVIYTDYNINYYFDKKNTKIDSIIISNQKKNINVKLVYSQYSIWENLYLPTKTLIYTKIRNKRNKIILNLIKRTKKSLDR